MAELASRSRRKNDAVLNACPICLEDMTTQATFTTTCHPTAPHTFCIPCIKFFFSQHRHQLATITCPCCNQSLANGDVERFVGEHGLIPLPPILPPPPPPHIPHHEGLLPLGVDWMWMGAIWPHPPLLNQEAMMEHLQQQLGPPPHAHAAFAAPLPGLGPPPLMRQFT